MLFEVVDFILACEVHVASRGDDFDVWSKNLECKVESYLVVSGTCAAMGYILCANLFGVIDNGDGLEYAFGAY